MKRPKPDAAARSKTKRMAQLGQKRLVEHTFQSAAAERDIVSECYCFADFAVPYIMDVNGTTIPTALRVDMS
jgi:hypothetical protein